MRLVFVSSPLHAETLEGIAENRAYALQCVRDSISRGEAPYAPHLFMTTPFLLNDLLPEDRAIGITVGMHWGRHADLIAVYIDKGISSGMKAEIDRFRHRGIPIEERSLVMMEVEQDVNQTT